MSKVKARGPIVQACMDAYDAAEEGWGEYNCIEILARQIDHLSEDLERVTEMMEASHVT